MKSRARDFDLVVLVSLFANEDHFGASFSLVFCCWGGGLLKMFPDEARQPFKKPRMADATANKAVDAGSALVTSLPSIPVLVTTPLVMNALMITPSPKSRELAHISPSSRDKNKWLSPFEKPLAWENSRQRQTCRRYSSQEDEWMGGRARLNLLGVQQNLLSTLFSRTFSHHCQATPLSNIQFLENPRL